MAFIPNKELYIGLSGCVTALACLWANSMRKKNRNTKTRLRQELLDLRDMIIGAEEEADPCNRTAPCPPCERPAQHRDACSEPRNVRGRQSFEGSPRQRTSDGGGGQRRSSGAGMGNVTVGGRSSFSGGGGADSLLRGRSMGAHQDLRKGSPGERYVVHPTANGVIISPILPNQSANAIKKQQERIIEKYSPKAGPSGMQRQTARCDCPEERHRTSCPRR